MRLTRQSYSFIILYNAVSFVYESYTSLPLQVSRGNFWVCTWTASWEIPDIVCRMFGVRTQFMCTAITERYVLWLRNRSSSGLLLYKNNRDSRSFNTSAQMYSRQNLVYSERWRLLLRSSCILAGCLHTFRSSHRQLHVRLQHVLRIKHLSCSKFDSLLQ